MSLLVVSPFRRFSDWWPAAQPQATGLYRGHQCAAIETSGHESVGGQPTGILHEALDVGLEDVDVLALVGRNPGHLIDGQFLRLTVLSKPLGLILLDVGLSDELVDLGVLEVHRIVRGVFANCKECQSCGSAYSAVQPSKIELHLWVETSADQLSKSTASTLDRTPKIGLEVLLQLCRHFLVIWLFAIPR